jgi:hypothetical protein
MNTLPNFSVAQTKWPVSYEAGLVLGLEYAEPLLSLGQIEARRRPRDRYCGIALRV